MTHIDAKVIADSICNERRITTLQIQVPRIILAEFNTHRVFCRNFSSSRAIPSKKLRAEAWNDPFIPVYWGANQDGMSAKNELAGWRKFACRHLWTGLGKVAVVTHYLMEKCGLHKQTCNRILEPWLSVTGVVTATEWTNFFKLRCNYRAQPEMQMLAFAIKKAMTESTPEERDYHIPFVDQADMLKLGELSNWDDKKIRSLAVKVAIARTCRVSYNNMYGKKSQPEEDIKLFHKLLEDGHMSPFEAVAVAYQSGTYEEDQRNYKGWCPIRAFVEPVKDLDELADKYKIDLRDSYDSDAMGSK